MSGEAAFIEYGKSLKAQNDDLLASWRRLDETHRMTLAVVERLTAALKALCEVEYAFKAHFAECETWPCAACSELAENETQAFNDAKEALGAGSDKETP